jgi:hypothetical protein
MYMFSKSQALQDKVFVVHCLDYARNRFLKATIDVSLK